MNTANSGLTVKHLKHFTRKKSGIFCFRLNFLWQYQDEVFSIVNQIRISQHKLTYSISDSYGPFFSPEHTFDLESKYSSTKVLS